MWAHDAKKDTTAVVVRGRGVLCNNGDSAKPEGRARLIAREIDHGHDESGQFYASTPPLEANTCSGLPAIV